MAWLCVLGTLFFRQASSGGRFVIAGLGIGTLAVWLYLWDGRRFLRTASPPTASPPPTSPPQESHSPNQELSTSQPVADQSQRRWRENSGDVIHGTVRLQFEPGERQREIHVGFCPPFRGLPHVEAEWVGGDEGTVAVSNALWHGATLEVRLPRPTLRQASVEVEYHALEKES